MEKTNYFEIGDKLISFRRVNGKVTDLQTFTVSKTTKTQATLNNGVVLHNCDSGSYGRRNYDIHHLFGVPTKYFSEKGERYIRTKYYEYSEALIEGIEKHNQETKEKEELTLFAKSFAEKSNEMTLELSLMLKEAIEKYNLTAETPF